MSDGIACSVVYITEKKESCDIRTPKNVAVLLFAAFPHNNIFLSIYYNYFSQRRQILSAV